MPAREPGTSAARPPMVRQANLRAVLEVFRTTSPLTASDIIEHTGLSRASVHAVCDELISRRLVRELAQTPPSAGSGMGRPSRTYDFHARAGHVVAIDLSPRTVRALLCDLRGDVVASASRSGPEGRPTDAVVDEARAHVDEMLTTSRISPESVLALTVGVPAPVSPTGRVLGSNVALPGIESADLVTAFSTYGWKVIVENDANLAILGERWLGVAQGSEHAVLILAGERLGAGIVAGGQLIRGFGGSAGEMDFLALVEGVGDTKGIGSIARELADVVVADARRAAPGEGAPGALLASLVGGDDHASLAHVLAASAQSDPAALAILGAVAERAARTVAVVSTILNPEIVVLGGAIALGGDALLDPIRRRLPRYTKSPARLATSSLGDLAVATGATRVALDHALATLLA